MWIKAYNGCLVNSRSLCGIVYNFDSGVYFVKGIEAAYDNELHQQGQWNLGEFESKELAMEFINNLYTRLNNDN